MAIKSAEKKIFSLIGLLPEKKKVFHMHEGAISIRDFVSACVNIINKVTVTDKFMNNSTVPHSPREKPTHTFS